MLRDRRLDSGTALLAQDHVLRVRRWLPEAGAERAEIGWKGPTGVSPEGLKQREEIEVGVEHGAQAERLLEALGYRECQAIDRFVEVYALEGAELRLEWYPRMDVLVEIEGDLEAIERAIRRLGFARERCRSEALPWFAARFEERTGERAILAEAGLEGAAPGWARA
jgi:adenylate cyclase class IV